jgi:multimeric flavodoxin WrbA
MKVIAFNSSPRMNKGNTALILNPFLDGIREAGAEAELFYNKKLKINHCQACFNCWYKTPGICSQKDDMQWLLPKMQESNIWVLATPVYADGVTALLKILMERTVPLATPLLELKGDYARHPAIKGLKVTQVVLVSSCGYWEMENFEPLLAHIKAFCNNASVEFAGALLRPHASKLRPLMDPVSTVDDIFKASKEAGQQLVKYGKMSPDTLRIISRQLLPFKTFVELTNKEKRESLAHGAEVA